ncbi:MAG: hypothetical protein KAW61_05190, partial [candidate division Zixibacteria bacterium]|nr:hypothetical protein [candidate division Zixibacteria bacterium]
VHSRCHLMKVRHDTTRRNRHDEAQSSTSFRNQPLVPSDHNCYLLVHFAGETMSGEHIDSICDRVRIGKEGMALGRI